MFASLKNKIREEIGSDVSTVVRNAGSVRGINSKHLSQTGSSSSISGSQISLDECRENNIILSSPIIELKSENNFDFMLADGGGNVSSKNLKKLESRDEEWRKKMMKKEAEIQKRLEKKDEEWRVKMLEKEKEWKKILEKQDKEKLKAEDEKHKAENARRTLELALRNAEEYKRKLYSFQEDAEQLEGFQTQEMAKIKNLLLAKEQEVEEKSSNLKVALSEVDVLKSEVSRLRRYEDELTNIQDEMETLRHTTQREKAQLSGELAQTKEEVRHLNVKVFVLEQRVAQSNDQSNVDERIADLMRERTLLERKLEEAHLHLSDIKTSWSGKISSLETQVGRLSRQAGEEGLERRRVEKEKEELKQRVKQLEAEIEVNTVVMATKDAKLLRMAEDIDEMVTELKELRASVDDEVEEFKRQIESSEKEIKSLKSRLEKQSKQFSAAETELEQLKIACNAEKENNSSLHLQLARLRESLESERTNSATLRVNMEKERDEKDSALLRNAQVSQDYEIAVQEKRRQEAENTELQTKLETVEDHLRKLQKTMDETSTAFDEAKTRLNDVERVEADRKKNEGMEQTLRNNLSDMEIQLNDKNKTIKVLQQRLGDMKKTLQRELRVPSSSLDSDAEPGAAILSTSSSKTVTAKNSSAPDEDVNFKYLKHVLIKFLTSREYEALHLTRAVATLLHFSPEEERLLQETLEWKMSWFGTRPNLGIGQTAKAIPPS